MFLKIEIRLTNKKREREREILTLASSYVYRSGFSILLLVIAIILESIFIGQ
jgi:hypothetical protein